MVLCIEPTGVIAGVFNLMTSNITGSLFLTTLIIALLIIAISAMFGIPIEYIAILTLPFHLGLLACMGDWLAITGTILIYLGIILGKNFFFR